MKHVIDIDIWLDDRSSYFETLGNVTKVTVPSFGEEFALTEDEVEVFAEMYASILRRFKNEAKPRVRARQVCLHLSTLNALTALIGLKLKEEGWEIYNRNLDLPECRFSTIETSEALLIDTYKVFFPFTKKFC